MRNKMKLKIALKINDYIELQFSLDSCRFE